MDITRFGDLCDITSQFFDDSTIALFGADDFLIAAGNFPAGVINFRMTRVVASFASNNDYSIVCDDTTTTGCYQSVDLNPQTLIEGVYVIVWGNDSNKDLPARVPLLGDDFLEFAPEPGIAVGPFNGGFVDQPDPQADILEQFCNIEDDLTVFCQSQPTGDGCDLLPELNTQCHPPQPPDIDMTGIKTMQYIPIGEIEITPASPDGPDDPHPDILSRRFDLDIPLGTETSEIFSDEFVVNLDTKYWLSVIVRSPSTTQFGLNMQWHWNLSNVANSLSPAVLVNQGQDACTTITDPDAKWHPITGNGGIEVMQAAGLTAPTDNAERGTYRNLAFKIYGKARTITP